MAPHSSTHRCHPVYFPQALGRSPNSVRFVPVTHAHPSEGGSFQGLASGPQTGAAGEKRPELRILPLGVQGQYGASP